MKPHIPRTIATALITVSLAACGTSSSPTAPSNAGSKPYPLQTCIVTGNDLDSMGGRITRSYQGQEIQFCCKPCVRKFEANPGRYLSKLP